MTGGIGDKTVPINTLSKSKAVNLILKNNPFYISLGKDCRRMWVLSVKFLSTQIFPNSF